MPFDQVPTLGTVSFSRGFVVPAKSAAAFDVVPDGWQDIVAERLARLRQFRTGWDGHQGRPIRVSIVDYVCSLLPRIMRPGLPAPFIAPLSSGGLQLEWHRNGWDVEIEIVAPGELYVYSHEVATNRETELSLTDDLSALAPTLANVTTVTG